MEDGRRAANSTAGKVKRKIAVPVYFLVAEALLLVLVAVAMGEFYAASSHGGVFMAL